MDSSVSPKDEIWFLRVCHHISTDPTYCITHIIIIIIIIIIIYPTCSWTIGLPVPVSHVQKYL